MFQQGDAEHFCAQLSESAFVVLSVLKSFLSVKSGVDIITILYRIGADV